MNSFVIVVLIMFVSFSCLTYAENQGELFVGVGEDVSEINETSSDSHDDTSGPEAMVDTSDTSVPKETDSHDEFVRPGNVALLVASINNPGSVAIVIVGLLIIGYIGYYIYKNKKFRFME